MYGRRAAPYYPPASKALHWLVAACVLVTLPVAVVMVRLAPGPLQDTLYNFHKSLGLLIFVLMTLRLVNRIALGAPGPERGIETWQIAASSAVHASLYVLLLTMPIVGYAANSAFGAPTPFFGLLLLPSIVAYDEQLSEWLFTIHRLMGWLVIILILVHISAAMFHFIVRRDGVLQRMLPKLIGGR